MSQNKSSVSTSYVVIVAIGSFTLAIIFAMVSEIFVNKMSNTIFSFAILFLMILIGIIFDVIGTAVAAADEKPFHAMAANRVLGAQQGFNLIRKADRVANICNDVIGDITGTASGALGISIIARAFLNNSSKDFVALNILMTAAIASLTISGKAIGKGFALKNANIIIFFVGKNMAFVEKTLGKDPFRKNRRSKGNR